MDDKRPAIGYIRVSTSTQAEEGVSLDAQEAKLRAWASLYDYDMIHVYRDPGISGRSLRKRPEAQAAIADVRRLRCPLVFYSLSRMVRNVKEAIQIIEDVESAGGSLASVIQRYDTSTVAGWMAFIMEAVLAEIEVRQVSERTRHAMQYKKSAGQRVGSIPYGKMLALGSESELVDCPAEHPVIQRVRELEHSQGLSAIAKSLTSSGYRTRSGRPWSAKQVSRIISGPECRPAILRASV